MSGVVSGIVDDTKKGSTTVSVDNMVDVLKSGIVDVADSSDPDTENPYPMPKQIIKKKKTIRCAPPLRIIGMRIKNSHNEYTNNNSGSELGQIKVKVNGLF